MQNEFFTKKYSLTRAEITSLICTAMVLINGDRDDVLLSARIAEKIDSHLSGSEPFPDFILKMSERRAHEMFDSYMDEKVRRAGTQTDKEK